MRPDLNGGWRFCRFNGVVNRVGLVLVFGLSSSRVLPRVRAVLDYVRTTAPGFAAPRPRRSSVRSPRPNRNTSRGSGAVPKLFPRSPSPYARNELVAVRPVSLVMRCLLDKVAEQILFDLWRADFPNTTIDEVVMNIDEGQKNHGTKR